MNAQETKGRELGGAGSYAVIHRGPNDYAVVNKTLGTVVSTHRNQADAWAGARWYYSNRINNDNQCIYCGKETSGMICSDECQRNHYGL